MNTSLNLEVLKTSVPAIFAEGPDPKMSNRYNFANSRAILENLVGSGWQINSAKQVGDNQYSAHQVILRHNDFHNVGDVLPQIMFNNSHNGTSKMDISMGIFRLVCSNGLVVPTSVANTISMKHVDLSTDFTEVMTNDFFSKIPVIFNRMGEMQERVLGQREIEEFAQRAIDIRFDKSANKVDFEQVLRPYREEDKSNDLWTIFNVLQEKVIKGGVKFQNTNRRSKPIVNFINDNKLNTQLWEIAEEYLVV
jgi:hypothetical protein